MQNSLIYKTSDEKEAIRQGEILTSVTQFKPVPDQSSSSFENISFRQILHPYAIVVSQDCDLDWDYTARQNQDKANKLLNSILFCEVYIAQEIRSDKTLNINSADWNLVKSNRHQQYHFFEKVPSECELSHDGLPELTVDFKKIFAIDSDFLYYQINTKRATRRTVLISPYVQHFSNRYHEFHGRVALPAPHESEKGG
jgi:hypothetical protein